MDDPPLYTEGTLTAATDKPAYTPWFEGSPKNYSGYEGDVANEVAKRMDLPIKWVVEPFNKSYAPGAKDFDFDISQVTITPERRKAVEFSKGYFDNTQGVLVMKDNPAADAKSISDLKDLTIGAQVGTTALDFVNETVKPTRRTQDLRHHQRRQVSVGERPDRRLRHRPRDHGLPARLRDRRLDRDRTVPANEQFGIVLEQDNQLVGCVNEALTSMKEDGTLEKLKKEHLQQYLDVPTLEK